MELLIKLAARNIWRHSGQSLVIGIILFLGAALMTVGNGIISGMEKGLQKTIVHGFTGDFVLIPDKQESESVFMQMMGRGIEPIYNYPEIKKALEKYPMVDKFLPEGKNVAMVLNEDDGPSSYLNLIGVDFDLYQKMFPDNIKMLEGSFPKQGEKALVLPKGARNRIQNETNTWFIPLGKSLDTNNLEGEAKEHRNELVLKSNAVLMGFNEDNSATDIRLNISGIFRYSALNTIFGNFALLDIESYRQCLGYFLAEENSTTILSARDSALMNLEGENLDNLFSESMQIDQGESSKKIDEGVLKTEAKPKDISLQKNIDRGAHNLVLVLLKPGLNENKALKEINEKLKADSLHVRAVPWKSALGPIGSIAVLIKGALFLFVTFLFIVAVIIIINTLTMAAMERNEELGMMRAIGAQKSFISMMFLSETAMLSLIFGGIGIVFGIGTIEILTLLKLSSENDMLQLFFGGDIFKPLLTLSDIGIALIQIALVTGVAVIYPLIQARRITPLDAIGKE